MAGQWTIEVTSGDVRPVMTGSVGLGSVLYSNVWARGRLTCTTDPPLPTGRTVIHSGGWEDGLITPGVEGNLILCIVRSQLL